MKVRNALLAGCFTVCALGAVHAASLTYDYTGQPMSGTVYGDPYPYSPPMPGGLILDGTITLSAPLAPNLVDAPVAPTYAAFSLSGYAAGGSLFPGNPTLQFGPTSADYILFANTMDFSTNRLGQITGWNISLFTPGPLIEPPDWTATSSSAGDTGSLVVTTYNVTAAETTIASNKTAGTWAAAPEFDASLAAAGLVLLLGGVAVLHGRRLQ